MALEPQLYRQTADEILQFRLPEDAARLKNLVLRLTAALDTPGQTLLPFLKSSLSLSQNETLRQLLAGNFEMTVNAEQKFYRLEEKMAENMGRIGLKSPSDRQNLLRIIQRHVFQDLEVRDRIEGRRPRSVPQSPAELPTTIDALLAILKPRRQFREILGTTRMPREADDLPDEISTLKTMASSLITLLRGAPQQIQHIKDRLSHLNMDTWQAAGLSTLLRQSEMSVGGMRIAMMPPKDKVRDLKPIALDKLSDALNMHEGITVWRNTGDRFAIQPQDRSRLLGLLR